MARSCNSSSRCSMMRDILVTSANSCLRWCSSSLVTIPPWFSNASIITRRNSCQITSIRPSTFRLFSFTKFTCPLSGCRPSFLHLLVNSFSSSPASPCWDLIPLLCLYFIQFIPSIIHLSFSFISGALRYLCSREGGNTCFQILRFVVWGWDGDYLYWCSYYLSASNSNSQSLSPSVTSSGRGPATFGQWSMYLKDSDILTYNKALADYMVSLLFRY